jgi:hypothetical protein
MEKEKRIQRILSRPWGSLVKLCDGSCDHISFERAYVYFTLSRIHQDIENAIYRCGILRSSIVSYQQKFSWSLRRKSFYNIQEVNGRLSRAICKQAMPSPDQEFDNSVIFKMKYVDVNIKR